MYNYEFYDCFKCILICKSSMGLMFWRINCNIETKSLLLCLLFMLTDAFDNKWKKEKYKLA